MFMSILWLVILINTFFSWIFLQVVECFSTFDEDRGCAKMIPIFSGHELKHLMAGGQKAAL